MSKSNKSIMIVDDSKVSRMMIKSKIISKFPDWTVYEAANGDEALALSKENNNIDYFSIDFNMPGMDGLELIEALQNDFPTAQMGLLTANIQEDIFKRAMSLGAACFHKPITEQVIEELMEYFNG